MGAFLGFGDVGVWANNRERDAFLDWFAENRCELGDTRYEYCKSGAQRYTGRCIELEELFNDGELLELKSEEYSAAAERFWPHVAQLLGIIDSITRREWQIRVDSCASIDWRRD